MKNIDNQLIKELSQITDPGLLLVELYNRFKDRMAIGTSGQLTGSTLIAMAVDAGVKPRVFTNDTYRLFPETYDLFNSLEKKYGIQIERFYPDPKELDEMITKNGEYLFFDTKEKQELCCRIRKVHPNNKALSTLDVWVTGLRLDQSMKREKTSRFEIIQHKAGETVRPILKVSPLIDWSEDKVRKYIKEHKVPLHKLLEKNLLGGWYYESLGCVICTTPIGPNESRRSGRWRWFNDPDSDKECGLHLPPPTKT